MRASIRSFLAFPPVDRSHVERMAEHELDPLSLAEIREPVPGEDAFHRDTESVAIWLRRSQEGLGRGRHVLVEHDLALRVENAEVHRPSVKIDATVVRVLPGVESHGSLLVGCWLTPSLPSVWVGSGGAFISIMPIQTDGPSGRR